jgi:hypothetical protein
MVLATIPNFCGKAIRQKTMSCRAVVTLLKERNQKKREQRKKICIGGEKNKKVEKEREKNREREREKEKRKKEREKMTQKQDQRRDKD